MIEESMFAQTIINQRYSQVKSNGSLETWKEISHRVAKHVLGVVDLPKDIKNDIEDIISKKQFIPAGRYLFATGRPFKQISNCLSLRAEDSREGWSDLLRKASMALMTGAGIGVNYSSIREEGSPIIKTGGTASGPISLIKMLNEVGREVKQGGTRRCLPKGSLVHTKYGLLPIEEINNNSIVLTTKGYKKVLNTFNQGIQNLIDIKTQIGTFSCTPNHKIAVLIDIYGNYKWICAEELQIGDRLIYTSSSVDGKKTTLPKSNYIRSSHAFTVKEITIPELNTEIAWLIGYFHANGYVLLKNDTGNGKRHGRVAVSIPKSAENVKNKVYDCLKQFGIIPYIKDGCGECWNITVSSVPLALYFLEYIKQAKTSIIIPNFILEGTVDIRSAYIAGVMDGDGSISSRPIIIASTIYPNYAEQLQVLCASLGVTTKFHLIRNEIDNWKSLYRLSLKGTKQEIKFLETVGKFLIYKKFNLNNRGTERYSYSFPSWMIKNSDKKQYFHTNYNTDFPIERVEEVIGNLSFTPIQVLDIEEGGSDETYDIEIEDNHEFFCNGYLVHNSACLSILSWKHPDIHKYIKSKEWKDNIKEAKSKDFNFPATLDGTNISVQLDDDFFTAFHNITNRLHSQANSVYWAVIENMLKTGEPGFTVDIGENKYDDLRNACSEFITDTDSECCNLGSINLARINSLDEMKKVVELGTIFLLAGSIYGDVPYPEVKQVIEKNRKIGLGLMGLHEWLLIRNKKYDVDNDLGKYLEIYATSTEIAHKYCNKFGINNSIKTRCVAPSGTISLVAETTSGIEPLFCAAYKRRYRKGADLIEYQYVLDPTAKRLVDKGINPDFIEDAYVLSENVEKRIQIQAWLQKYVDMGISSTINLPAFGTAQNNNDSIISFGNTLIKYLPKLRGITAYPDGSRGAQPMVPVKWHTAEKHVGHVFIEGGDICSLKGGSCNS